jgi:hypothetical protein
MLDLDLLGMPKILLKKFLTLPRLELLNSSFSSSELADGSFLFLIFSSLSFKDIFEPSVPLDPLDLVLFIEFCLRLLKEKNI